MYKKTGENKYNDSKYILVVIDLVENWISQMEVKVLSIVKLNGYF